MQKNMTKRVCLIAVLIAMQIVLGRIAAINVGSYLKISFGFIPIAVCGILTGPVWTLLMASVCDVLGALLFPTGAFYWGFTLVAAVGGLIYGLFLHNQKQNIIRCLLCTLTVALICNILLNILKESLILSQHKADTIRFENAKERYARTIKDHPDIIRRAPLHIVASYLQMTPETLSRVRTAASEAED